MSVELKFFALRLLGILIIAPLAGWMLLRFVEKCESSWKSGNRRKQWIIMCGVFVLLAVIGGWLR